MSFKKIVAFGDSWIYGDELLSPGNNQHFSHYTNNHYRKTHCFVGLLGQHYNVPAENHGISGGSLQSTAWSFLQWFESEPEPEQCLILIGLTESDRFSFYNPEDDTGKHSMIHSTWVDSNSTGMPREFKTLIKQHIALTSCRELSSLMYQQTVRLFDGMCARHNLKLLQFHISEPPTILNLPSLIEPEFNLGNWFVHELQPVHGRHYIKPGGHPNELGHQLVRDRLISWIESCIIKGC